MLPSPRLLRRVTNHSWSWEPSPADKPSYTLGLWQGAALYVGAVIGTGILVLPAFAAETAGPASVLAWLALVLLSFPLALTYAALSRDQPDAAGFAGAIERGFGPRGGAAAGWIFLAQAPTGYVIAALIAGEYAASLIGGGREARFALGGGLVALAYVLNAAGLRISARATPVCRRDRRGHDADRRPDARPRRPIGIPAVRSARRRRRWSRRTAVVLGIRGLGSHYAACGRLPEPARHFARQFARRRGGGDPLRLPRDRHHRDARVRPCPGIGDPACPNGGEHLRAGRRDRGRHRRLRTVIRAGERVYSRYQSPDLCTRSPPAASSLARRRVGIGHPAARARRHGDVVRCRRGALVRRRVEHPRSAAAIHLVVHRDVRALDGGGYAPAGSAPKVRGCSLARRMRWRAVLRRGAARMDRRRRDVLSRVPVARDASAYGGAGTSAGCGWA